ncbi:homoserine kinase [Parenemella sanctibonifatiensis]|uniref:Homoserine kinase n=1 Tax=Parenemella sanctibonifatiensis TaxID=2016505 RepID=A0A255EIY2_9ACTN|nr:homoserine kinase [Parenemella sanctibonifatiensis]OYN90941.1 homoserine kinase [Parenemella sanctibonifatiensis]
MSSGVSPLPVGRVGAVSVPATSANLGAGFDCLGLALDWRDQMSVTVAPTTTVTVTGEGAEDIPRDESHLVLASIKRGLAELGHTAPGFDFVAHNTIPHGRGIGSSAAAIIAGLALAWQLARPDLELGLDFVLELGIRIEGHADNAAPAVLGGAVLGVGERAAPQLVSLDLAPQWRCVVDVPTVVVPTSTARKVLPDSRAVGESIAESSRLALTTLALAGAVGPEQLLAATEDPWHQRHRGDLMPQTRDWIAALRAEGFPAVVSGAGPTVLTLIADDQEPPTHEGFARHVLVPGAGVRSAL